MTDQTLPADLQPFVDAAIVMARKRLEQPGGELSGMAFIDVKGESLVAIPMSDAPSKDAWARMVRTVSSMTDARFVVTASEIWVHETNAGHGELDRLLDQYGEVRLIPGRRDALLVQIETHVGLWQGIADVVPLAAVPGARTFGALELRMAKHFEGRLIGLLGSRRGRSQ